MFILAKKNGRIRATIFFLAEIEFDENFGEYTFLDIELSKFDISKGQNRGHSANNATGYGHECEWFFSN